MFHIQTEDYGYPRCYFCSHIFVSGQVIRSVRTEYPSQEEQQSSEEELRSVMLTAHRSLFKMLQNGDFDEYVASRPANDIVPAANETGLHKPTKAADSPKSEPQPVSSSDTKNTKSPLPQGPPLQSKQLAPPPLSTSKPAPQAKPSPPQKKGDSEVRGPIRLSWPPCQESSPQNTQGPGTPKRSDQGASSTAKPLVQPTPATPSSSKAAPSSSAGKTLRPSSDTSTKQTQAKRSAPLAADKEKANSAASSPAQAKPKPSQSPTEATTTKPAPAAKAMAPGPTGLSLAPVALEGLKGLSNGIKGLLAVAYFDTTTLKPLFVSDGGLSLEQSLDALAEFCFALQSSCEGVSPDQGHFEVVSQTKEHFLIMIQITGSAQLFLAISRKLGNLAMARYALEPAVEILREHPPKRG